MASGETALIVGVGTKLSASVARLCHKQGMKVALASRNVDKLADLAAEIDAKTYACDASQPENVSNFQECQFGCRRA